VAVNVLARQPIQQLGIDCRHYSHYTVITVPLHVPCATASANVWNHVSRSTPPPRATFRSGAQRWSSCIGHDCFLSALAETCQRYKLKTSEGFKMGFVQHFV
jgi:hypothetical protein